MKGFTQVRGPLSAQFAVRLSEGKKVTLYTKSVTQLRGVTNVNIVTESLHQVKDA